MDKQAVFYTELELCEGEIWTLLATEKGLCRMMYPGQPVEASMPWLERHLPHVRLMQDGRRIGVWRLQERLEAYFQGERVSFEEIPIDLWGTPFQREVWAELRRIPFGTTCSYRDLASAIGRPKAVRAVGAANGANPLPVIIPCHRVISTDRKLTGYRGGLTMKQRLLQLEGVKEVNPIGHDRFGF